VFDFQGLAGYFNIGNTVGILKQRMCKILVLELRLKSAQNYKTTKLGVKQTETSAKFDSTNKSFI
jgi:hypothetical protein